MILGLIDPLYLMIVGPTMLISLWASFKVKNTFNKYSKYRVATGMTGKDAAQAVLNAGGVHNVRIERVDGFLSDHYDPQKKVLRLSPDVYDSQSISAVGVGAHEAGHAIQDKVRYPMLRFRTAMVPSASIGSNFGYILMLIGFFMQSQGMITAGIVLFGAVVVFQLVTLPVEINASSRAKQLLWEYGVISDGAERRGVAAVLNAAAMTYVAAAVSSLATLFYFLLRSGLLGGSDD